MTNTLAIVAATNELSELFWSSLIATNYIVYPPPTITTSNGITVTTCFVPDCLLAPVSHTFCYVAMAGAFIVGAVFAWFWLTKGKWRLT